MRCRTSASLVGAAACALLSIALLAGCAGGKGEPENSSSPSRVRLMSAEQFSLTVAQIFGSDISASVVAPIPPLPRTDGLLAVGAASIGVTSDQLQQFQQAAAVIAAKVVDEEHRDYLIPCQPAAANAADNACAAQFLKGIGRLWYRRALQDAELAPMVEMAAVAANQLQDFYAGLTIVLERMLVSPQALFIVDIAESDPENPGQQRLTAYSLASRLSFFLWNAAPDDQLLQAAENGQLHTRKGLEREVDRMIASSRYVDGVRSFFDDFMGFSLFDSISKDAMAYPSITGATLADAREQTLRTVVDHLIVERKDYRDLFTTRKTFMSMNLAVAYGVSGVDGWVPYEFPENSPRAGLLSQVSFLASHAHPARSSATLRGKALRELFLCQIVPPPPPNVDFSLLDDTGDKLRTARERLGVHASNPSCAGCHKITDPIGLALENFDGAGRYRETERGAAIDTSGNLDGTQFNDVAGLGRALHDHAGLPACLVKRVYAYGTGGPVRLAKDREVLAYLGERFAKQGYRLPDLMRTVALSHVFSHVVDAGGAAPAIVAKAAAAPHAGNGTTR